MRDTYNTKLSLESSGCYYAFLLNIYYFLYIYFVRILHTGMSTSSNFHFFFIVYFFSKELIFVCINLKKNTTI